MFAVPAAAAQPVDHQHSSLTYRGIGAEAHWRIPGFPDAQPEIGEPYVFSLGGYRTPGLLQKQLGTGAHPEAWRMPALLAMAIRTKEDILAPPAEVWCLPEKSNTEFSIDRQLTSASLQMTCDGVVVTDEGDDPSGETIPLRVVASWNGAGSVQSEKHVTKTSGDDWWTLDRLNSSVRPATAEVTIIRTDVPGPAGVLFSGPVTNSDTGDPMAPPQVSMFNTAASLLVFGQMPEPEPGK
jgi:hypothetical protein